MTRINERIRVPEVRLIDDEGNQVGVLKIADALNFAQERDLDLVEVAPEARPPVCREHDYDTKKSHVERFLRHKDKVKITIMFRGREVTHPERGTAILERLATELAEFGVVEQHPTQEGRNMTMLMAPSKAVLAGRTELSVVPAETGADGAGAAQQPTAATGSQASNGGVADGADGGD